MAKKPRFCYPGSVMCGIYAYILYFILGSILYIQVIWTCETEGAPGGPGSEPVGGGVHHTLDVAQADTRHGRPLLPGQ